MNWTVWLKGLIAAVINGVASAATAAIVDPITFNPLQPGAAKNFGVLLVVAGAFGMFSYLKQSPLPNGQPK
ncbi:hypothetical protein [Candidatus Magnetobacterium casense]|uniref:Holin n=1 Tax=Candidatus Magnetobacterium casense TaxID=1455061 RepID=A0ABS6S4U7_9BACT|nr:hypothetical protein [Candidatus Magnetobacterium casensis]MBV6343419.1 hypothetical protein [Candidatus Magnetobacterium casensis]